MNDREAIEILQEEHDYAQLLSYVNEALKLAISALKEHEEREIKKENDDLISRKSLIKWLTEPTGFRTNCEDCTGTDCLDCIIGEAIENEPSVDPVVHGEWILVNKAYGEYKCSVCGSIDSDCSDYYSAYNVIDQDFCPNCGAKMDGGK